MVSVVESFSIKGVDGYIVEVEIKTIFGQPMFSIDGLGDTAVKESDEVYYGVMI